MLNALACTTPMGYGWHVASPNFCFMMMADFVCLNFVIHQLFI